MLMPGALRSLPSCEAGADLAIPSIGSAYECRVALAGGVRVYWRTTRGRAYFGVRGRTGGGYLALGLAPNSGADGDGSYRTSFAGAVSQSHESGGGAPLPPVRMAI